jgi:hypothetical protein
MSDETMRALIADCEEEREFWEKNLGLPRLLSAGSALAGAMKVALPWLELRANEETVATARAALSAWEEATKPAPLDGKGEEGSKP